MTELTSCSAQSDLCVREVEHTLKKKHIPLPKYLCAPGSLAFLDRIPILDKSDSLCSRIKCLFQNNDIDVDFGKIHVLQNNLDASGIQSGNESTAKSFKIGKFRRLLKKETKCRWLEASICRAFWSHLLLGSNEIIRCLESSACSKNESRKETQGKRISFVFVDFGWLASHYGHHLANLCKLLNIRLVAIKPTGSLPELVTTKLRPMKKLVVFGFCLSNETPSDLSDICKQIEIRFPVLGNDTSNISAVMGIKKQDTSHEMFTNHPEVPSSVNKKESWEDVKIDSKLYDYSSPAHKFTFSEFQPFLFSLALRSFGNEIFYGVPDNDNHSESENRCSFCAYKSPVLKAVVTRVGRKSLKRKMSVSQSAEISNSTSRTNVQSSIPVSNKSKNKSHSKTTK
ncbi:hypothetical protein MN116_001196 [Schistosoma mekongi]|uniref:Uncharacterized protein n=1 Tax=Schistosoma mekongi TaxID=38744 RepID=A0AAE2D901_SCHME|nr:hypothetical protein MN116_001196 [Schistosoma mekongi]